ncbi:MAG TPA: creatininase family protein [Euzebyales bacterium]|nr:creatininase family protein [Euzebyales bacterium]
MRLSTTQIAELARRTATAVLPLGSVEQHGPHLPCGTDTFAAELVAEALAERLDALLVPVGPYGVTPIHAGHPGTVSLRRTTFEALLHDVAEALVEDSAMDRLVLCNWHEGNNASLDAVATELQDDHPGVVVVTAHACYTAERIYAAEGGELTHGGGIETMAVLAHDPALVRGDLADTPARTDHAAAMDTMRRDREVHGYITDVTEIDRDGWYGRPGWATGERAAAFAERVAAEIAAQVTRIFVLREGTS